MDACVDKKNVNIKYVMCISICPIQFQFFFLQFEFSHCYHIETYNLAYNVSFIFYNIYALFFSSSNLSYFGFFGAEISELFSCDGGRRNINRAPFVFSLSVEFFSGDDAPVLTPSPCKFKLN